MTGNFDDAGVWSLGSQRVAHGENWTDSTPTEISVGSIGPVVEGLWTGSKFVMLATNGSYFSADGLVWTEALTGIFSLTHLAMG